MTPLHTEMMGEGPPLVMAHGFTQTGRLWGSFGTQLATSRQLVLVDLPGHGASGDERGDVVQSAQMLDKSIGIKGAERFDLLGYSLGARVALHVALCSPDRVARLVLIGATAGIEDPKARSDRRARDEQMAEQLDLSGDIEDFLIRWTANPMFANLNPGQIDMPERRRNTASGLSSSLRLAGTGSQDPVWDRLGELSLPILVLAGANDPRFAASGARIARATGGCFSLVPGAGHALHLEQPAVAARIVSHWLDTAGRG